MDRTTAKSVRNLVELLGILRQYGGRPEDSPAKTINFLRAVAAAHGLNLRYESLGAEQHASATGATSAEGTLPAPVADTTVVQNSSATQASEAPIIGIRRIMLSANHARAMYGDQLYRQCNGVVIEYGTWQVLSVPPQTLSTRYRESKLRGILGSYNIYRIRDGTVVTLYNYLGQWRLSSSNCYEIDNMIWLGTRTYRDVLNELLGRYVSFSINSLDTRCCYSLGIRHHDTHPFLADPDEVWFIQSYNLDTGEISTDNNTGLPEQVLETRLPTKNPLKAMMDNNSLALRRYLDSGAIHYGYVLRAKQDVGELNNLLMESSLLVAIRQAMYNIPKLPYLRSSQDRINYVVMKSYFSGGARDNIFLRLFPQLRPVRSRVVSMINIVSGKIQACMRNREKSDQVANGQSPINALVSTLLADIEKNARVNPFDAASISIIRDYICDTAYAENYLAYLRQ